MNKQYLAATLIAQLLATTAWAQTAQPAPSTDGTGDGTVEVTDIIVTAQKRQERLQDVPIAVATVGADQLASAGIKDLQDLNTLVPGLNIAYSVGAFQPSIRGISTSSNVVENPVALYIDGVYLASQREGLRDLADIEQITVLKGPQGTLFGRNSTAGVIQITTRAPSHTPGAQVSVGIDNYDTVRASGYLTGGLGEDLAASLSMSYATQGQGWGKSLSKGFETYKLNHSFSARGKLLFTPGDRTRITLIGDYLKRRDTGTNYQPYPGTAFSYPGFGPTKSRYDTYAGTPGWNAFKGGGVSLEIDHDLDFARLVSISAYRKSEGGIRFDFTNVETPFIISTAKSPSESFSQEIQLISPSGGDLQWVAGVFYFHNKLEYVNFRRVLQQPFPPIPTLRSITSDSGETTESIAPFAQVDYEFAPGTKLTVGGRWTYEKRRISGANTLVTIGGATILQPAVTPSTQTLKDPSWRVAIDHKFNPDVLAYASYNRGIKSGGYNIGGPNLPAYKPEKLDAFEVGLKSQLMDRRLTLNIAGFYYSYRNLQVSTFLGNSTSAVVTNGAKAKLYGLDVDMRAELTDELSVNGGFSAMHSEFVSFPRAPISTPLPTGGARIVPGDASGNRLPLAQDFVGTLALNYVKSFGDVKTHFNVTGTYNSDYYFEPDNFIRQPSYVMLNGSLRFSDREDKLNLTFAVNNILNESIIARNNTQAYAYFVNYGYAPRVYSVTAGFKF